MDFKISCVISDLVHCQALVTLVLRIWNKKKKKEPTTRISRPLVENVYQFPLYKQNYKITNLCSVTVDSILLMC